MRTGYSNRFRWPQLLDTAAFMDTAKVSCLLSKELVNKKARPGAHVVCFPRS